MKKSIKKDQDMVIKVIEVDKVTALLLVLMVVNKEDLARPC